MRAKGWTILSTVATVVVLAIAALYGLAALGLKDRHFVCRGHATSPASSEVVAEQGRLQISEYAPFVQSLARLLRDDIVGEAEAVFISDLTGVAAEHQITASGSAGARSYNDFSLHRQFTFTEATGLFSFEQSGIVFQGSCLFVGD
jgi:hypothetical protein